MHIQSILSTQHLSNVVFNELNQETASTCIVSLAPEDYKAPALQRNVFGSCFNGQLCCTAGPLRVSMGLLRHYYTHKHHKTWTKRFRGQPNVTI